MDTPNRKGGISWSTIIIIGVLLVLVAVICVSIFNCSKKSKAEIREPAWLNVWGDPESYNSAAGFGEISASTIAVAPDGYVYVAGGFTGKVDADPGPGSYNLSSVETDFFLSKFDEQGDWIWSRSWGPTTIEPERPSGDIFGTIDFDSSGIVLFCSDFRGEYDFDPSPDEEIRTSNIHSGAKYVSKFDSDGNFLDVLTWPENFRAMGNFSVDTEGNFLALGTYSSENELESLSDLPSIEAQLSYNRFVGRFNPDGSLIWMDTWSDLFIRDLIEDSYGNIYICASCDVEVDLDPGPETDIVLPVSTRDPVLIKLDSHGSFIWARQWSYHEYTWPHAIALDTDGNIYIGGSSLDHHVDALERIMPDASDDIQNLNRVDQGILVKFGQNGNLIWKKSFGTGWHIYKNSRGVGGNRIIMYGTLYREADFDPSPAVFNIDPDSGMLPYVCEFNLDGQLQWVSLLNWTWQDPDSFNYEHLNRIALNNQGDIYATGEFGATSFLAMIPNE